MLPDSTRFAALLRKMRKEMKKKNEIGNNMGAHNAALIVHAHFVKSEAYIIDYGSPGITVENMH